MEHNSKMLFNIRRLCNVTACFYPFSNTLENIGDGKTWINGDAIVFYPFVLEENTHHIKIIIWKKIHDDPGNRRYILHGCYVYDNPDCGDYSIGRSDHGDESGDTDYSDNETILLTSGKNNENKYNKNITVPIYIAIPYLSNQTIFVAKINGDTYNCKNISDFVFKFTVQ